uniref:Calmodulin-binding domain-containing protein n=1 Tax=Arundo donax TaxID=35708 RepID=A0A0A9HS40_ARUDO
MEISEDTISGDGCREDFSEEVTSRAVLADDAFVHYDNIADDGTPNNVLDQDGYLANARDDAQKELGITRSNLEVASEETAIDQQTDQDGMEDNRKELEITTYKLEEASEEADIIVQASNPDGISMCVNGGAQMEPEITICKSKDVSEESGVTQESSLNDDADYVTDGAEMGPEITRCELEYASEETGIDQETVENDDSACVSDDAQNGSEITKCKLEDAFEESVTIQEVDGSDIAANFSSAARNESELTTCKSEDVSEETVIDHDDSSTYVTADHDDSSAYVTEGTQNESEVTTCESEGAREKSDAIKEDEDEDNTADPQNKPEITACESGCAQEESYAITQDEDKDNTAGPQKESEIKACQSGGDSEKSAVPREADGHVNTIDASESAPKDITMPKLDACDDIHVTEETNQAFNVQIPVHNYDCTTEGLAEPQNIPAEVTDAKEPSIDDICDAFSGMNLKGDVYFDPAESTTCPRNKLIISRRRTPEEEEYLRGFNPRAPNFLPLELDPDAEKVDLKHQMMDERKNAEEWMIDYALRRAVTNLAPARKKKVELLVQAFEAVLPHDEDDKKSITPTRPAQACN